VVESAFRAQQSSGAGQDDVAALLSTGGRVDKIGDIQVGDITFHPEVTGREDHLTVTVYYTLEPRRR
jgi:hypothetical protein